MIFDDAEQHFVHALGRHNKIQDDSMVGTLKAALTYTIDIMIEDETMFSRDEYRYFWACLHELERRAHSHLKTVNVHPTDPTIGSMELSCLRSWGSKALPKNKFEASKLLQWAVLCDFLQRGHPNIHIPIHILIENPFYPLVKCFDLFWNVDAHGPIDLLGTEGQREMVAYDPTLAKPILWQTPIGEVVEASYESAARVDEVVKCFVYADGERKSAIQLYLKMKFPKLNI